MPLPVIALPAFLSSIVSSLVVVLGVVGFRLFLKISAFLGLGSITYFGFGSLSDSFINLMMQNFQGLPQSLLQLLQLGQIDSAITVLISGHVTALGIRSVDSLTRVRLTNV